jgi:hypothetical protein
MPMAAVCAAEEVTASPVLVLAWALGLVGVATGTVLRALALGLVEVATGTVLPALALAPALVLVQVVGEKIPA